MSQGHFLAVHSSNGIFVVILVEQLDLPVHSRASAVKQLVKQRVKPSVKQPVKQLFWLNNSICQCTGELQWASQAAGRLA